LIPGHAENRSIGHVRFCTGACMLLWYEGPQRDRRREDMSVEIDRRVKTLISQS
jgi:hypothetical protein